jgi:chromosome segregation ATPase
MPTSEAMRPSDYAAAIEDQVKLKRHYLSLMNSRQQTENQIADMRQRAQTLLASADRLESELADAKNLYRRADDEVRRLHEGMVLCKQQGAIKTITRLTDELAELAPDQLAAIMAQLEAKVNNG